MHSAKHRPDRSDDVAEALQGMRESLRRLVELGESMLDVHERPSTMPVTSAIRSTTESPTHSVRSIHSENNTHGVVIDLMREDIITYGQASAMIPTHPSPATISRWCSMGCRGLTMESMYIGGRRKTTRQAVERFLIACRERHWGGIHGNTAHALERALAEQGFIVEPRQDDHTAHAAPVQPSDSRSKSSTRSRRPKTFSKDSPAMRKRTRRRLKPRTRRS